MGLGKVSSEHFHHCPPSSLCPLQPVFPLPTAPGTTETLSVTTVCVEWDQMGCTAQHPAVLTQCQEFEIHPQCPYPRLYSSFLFTAEYYSIIWQTIFCLSTHQLLNISVFSLGWLRIKHLNIHVQILVETCLHFSGVNA